MPTINQLPTTTQLSGGDQFPVYLPNTGDARRVSYTTIKDDIVQSITTDFDVTPGAFQNKTFNLGSNNILIGTLAQFNAACSDDNFVGQSVLAASNGSFGVGFIQAGTGAVARTAQDKMRELVTPQDFGVTFDGSPSDAIRVADFFAVGTPDINRSASRFFGGDAACFNGVFGGYANYVGLSPLTRALHNWAPRDAQSFTDSNWAGLCVVGSSQASKAVNWPGYPAFTPSSIGVAGFGINDAANGQTWGGYFDVVRMGGVVGFTVATEMAVANFGDISQTTPFTLTNGSAKSGVAVWAQSGAGLDLVATDIANIGETPLVVNHASAGFALLSSYQQLAIAAWANSTTYAVGDKREDVVTNTVFQCVIPNTSPATGSFSAARAANPTYWKAIPGFLTGLIFGATALAETAPGNNIFSAVEMTERMQVSWFRKTGAGVVEQSATIYSDVIADGSPVVDMVFQAGKIYTTALWSGNADGTTGGKIQGRGPGNAISFEWTGVALEFYVDNTLVGTI